MFKRKRSRSVAKAKNKTTEVSSSFTWKIQNFSKLDSNVTAEVWCDEQGKGEELNRNPKDMSLVEAEECASSVAEVDALLSDVQNLLGDKASDDAGASTGFMPLKLADEDIAGAKRILQECSIMTIATIFQSGRASDLKNSLSTMLIANAFPNKAAQEIVMFLAELDQTKDQYLAAQRDLQEAEEKENSVNKLRASLKQSFLELVAIRNRVGEVDKEAAELERQSAEINAKKARVRDSLEELVVQITASKQAMIEVEEDMRLFGDKKKRAEEAIGNMESLWESLKKE